MARDIDATIKSYDDATRRGLRRRGFAGDEFDSALSKAKGELDSPTPVRSRTVASGYEEPREEDDSVPRTSDSADPGDPNSHEKKLEGNYWARPPISKEEKAIYYGLHLHSPDNKFGLHSHVPGGSLTGGHTHGPQNRMGAHHHNQVEQLTDEQKQTQDPKAYMIDGHHVHNDPNMPTGSHQHDPRNFG